MSIFVFSIQATDEILFYLWGICVSLNNMLLRSNQVSANGFGQLCLGANIQDYKRRYGDY